MWILTFGWLSAYHKRVTQTMHSEQSSNNEYSTITLCVYVFLCCVPGCICLCVRVHYLLVCACQNSIVLLLVCLCLDLSVRVCICWYAQVCVHVQVHGNVCGDGRALLVLKGFCPRMAIMDEERGFPDGRQRRGWPTTTKNKRTTRWIHMGEECVCMSVWKGAPSLRHQCLFVWFSFFNFLSVHSKYSTTEISYNLRCRPCPHSAG